MVPNGLPSHLTNPFEYQTPKLSGIQMVTVLFFSGGETSSGSGRGVLGAPIAPGDRNVTGRSALTGVRSRTQPLRTRPGNLNSISFVITSSFRKVCVELGLVGVYRGISFFYSGSEGI